MLDANTFAHIIQHTPLVSIDLVVQNTQGDYLLGQRTQRPAQDSWFVPGGRIFKNESLDTAFQRLTLNELGQNLDRQYARLLDIYEHFYQDSMFDPQTSTHYVVLAYKLSLNLDLNQLPKQQHQGYRRYSAQQALTDPQVHPHSQAYAQALLAQSGFP